MATVERFDAAAFLGGLFRPPLLTPAPTEICPADLSGPWRELYEERAAIRQYDGGQAREHAEAEALREIVVLMGSTAGIGDGPAEGS